MENAIRNSPWRKIRLPRGKCTVGQNQGLQPCLYPENLPRKSEKRLNPKRFQPHVLHEQHYRVEDILIYPHSRQVVETHIERDNIGQRADRVVNNAATLLGGIANAESDVLDVWA